MYIFNSFLLFSPFPYNEILYKKKDPAKMNRRGCFKEYYFLILFQELGCKVNCHCVCLFIWNWIEAICFFNKKGRNDKF